MKPVWDVALLNRALWVFAALLAAASAALAGYWQLEDLWRSPKPLQLPSLELAAAPPAGEPKLPERNPFDVAGAAWRSRTMARTQAPALADVRGVLVSRTLSGIFTATGVVKTGEPFAGGTLEAVTAEGIVLRLPDGTTKLLQREEKDDKVRARLLEFWAEAGTR